MSIQYLAYGSNLCTARLVARIGQLKVLQTVTLNGWQVLFSKRGSDGSGKCSLEQVASTCAYAVLFEIPESARPVLDKIEGVGHGYHGEWIEVEGVGRCYTYLVDPDYRDISLKPFDWYKTLVVYGAREHQLPPAYVSTLVATESIADPDQERTRVNLSVIEAND